MEYINNNDETKESPLPLNAKRIAIAYRNWELHVIQKTNHGRLMAHMIALMQSFNGIYGFHQGLMSHQSCEII